MQRIDGSRLGTTVKFVTIGSCRQAAPAGEVQVGLADADAAKPLTPRRHAPPSLKHLPT